MKVFDLVCAQDHRFEGWFGSEADYNHQLDVGLLSCPMCHSHTIRRLPSATRLNFGATAAPAPAHTASASLSSPEGQGVEALWQQAVQHVLKHTEDVGARFAEEARRMHYGETDSRNIRGQATREEAEALQDEGIEVLAVPLPLMPPRGSLQ
ncbi:MAG: DUF1178 family protein [Leptothrix ochracea]|uniref:DUF1178 family protein n=1 Tax=Leptothrix ochracea TaxID=735331 RepID=UPI0034E2B8B9